MKLANVLMWIGRALGIIQVLFFGLINLISPPSEWWLYLIAGSIGLLVIYSIFLFVSWRKEILGGILYLIFIDILALLIIIYAKTEWGWEYIRLLIPSFVTGVLFLTSGILKRHRGRTG